MNEENWVETTNMRKSVKEKEEQEKIARLSISIQY